MVKKENVKEVDIHKARCSWGRQGFDEKTKLYIRAPRVPVEDKAATKGGA